jgi:hypothetical protein
VALRTGLDEVVKRKIPSIPREANPRTRDRPACSPALYRLSYRGSYYNNNNNNNVILRECRAAEGK